MFGVECTHVNNNMIIITLSYFLSSLLSSHGLSTRRDLLSPSYRRHFQPLAGGRGPISSKAASTREYAPSTWSRWMIESQTSTWAAANDVNVYRDDAPSKLSNASSRLEPLVSWFVLRAAQDSTHLDKDDTDSVAARFTSSDARQALLGLAVWQSALRKGRLPLTEDFQTHDYTTTWPAEPLFSHVHDALSALALPRLVRRHPETLTSVLLGVAKVVIEFINMQRRGHLIIHDNHHGDDNDLTNPLDSTMQELHPEQYTEYVALSDEQLKELAESLSDKLSQQWSGVVQGVAMLDSLFGYDHNMLDVQVRDTYKTWAATITVPSQCGNTLILSHTLRAIVDLDYMMEYGSTQDGNHCPNCKNGWLKCPNCEIYCRSLVDAHRWKERSIDSFRGKSPIRRMTC